MFAAGADLLHNSGAGGYGETELHWLSGANVNESRQEPQTKYFM